MALTKKIDLKHTSTRSSAKIRLPNSWRNTRAKLSLIGSRSTTKSMPTSTAVWGEQSGLLAGHWVHSRPIHDGNVADHYLGIGNAASKEVATLSQPASATIVIGPTTAR